MPKVLNGVSYMRNLPKPHYAFSYLLVLCDIRRAVLRVLYLHAV